MWKPMLAGKLEPPYEISNLMQYDPVLISPKLDGVRATVQDGVVLSRSLKPIPNLHVQSLFGKGELDGLDGELILGEPVAPDVFRKTTSAVMTITGKPNVFYYVFDIHNPVIPFYARIGQAEKLICKSKINAALLLKHYKVYTEKELFKYETDWITQGYEGVMIRSLYGPYKQGRSTLKEGWLLKLKRFMDGEAEVREVVVLLHNNNEAKTNELGRTARSSHKENMIPKNMMGSLVVKDIKTGVRFSIGTGFTEQDRKEIWRNAEEYVGKICRYKYFPSGSKDKPRFPTFDGWRDAMDIGD